MKKLALLLASVLLLTLFASCTNTPAGSGGSSTDGSSQTQQNSSDGLKVDVFYYDYSDVYISTVRNEMDNMFKELGVAAKNWDAAGSQPSQSDQVNTAITAGSNLLIVNIVETSSPDAAQGICDAAKNANIPIIFFNREVDNDVVNSYDKCAFVGTNAPDAGHMQGEMIGEYLLANYDALDLNGDGSISYVMFKGQEGNAEAEARTQFSVEDANKLLTKEGKPELVYYDDKASTKYLVDQNGKWSAGAANDYMNTILSAYSEANKNMVELVIANNDEMAKGAISALQGAGYNNGEGSKTIPVFGVDATADARTLIGEGKMTASVMQDAAGMAKTITTLAGNVKDGKDLMDGAADQFTVDDGVAKIRVPYQKYDSSSK
ncbi:MAG TPA: galactose ABC transporter substrate-binding protein [Candidatus Gallacutalibacter pullistercoris]|nr:galactose ABC transporter substrate-binding protein [Candidatus Gallacutalibacter pullistercoris]